MIYPEHQYETNSWLCMIHEFTSHNELQRIHLQADSLHVIALYLDVYYDLKPPPCEILLNPGEYSSRISRVLGKCLLDADIPTLTLRIREIPEKIPALSEQGKRELRDHVILQVSPIIQAVQILGDFAFRSGGMVVLPSQPHRNLRVR